MNRSAQNLLAVVRDAIGLAGLGAITFGAYQIYHPAGYIVGGMIAVSATTLLNLAAIKKSAIS